MLWAWMVMALSITYVTVRLTVMARQEWLLRLFREEQQTDLDVAFFRSMRSDTVGP